MRKKLASIAQRLKLPAICPLCNQYHRNNTALCLSCFSSILSTGAACTICANPLPDGIPGLCGLCIKQKPWFDEVWVSHPFEEPLRSLIHRFKYNQGLYLAKTLVSLMEKDFPEDTKPDYLIPVPLHPERLKIRGYNQAAILTQLLSRKYNIPYRLNLCRKVINTAPQATLPSEERKKNLQKAFSVKPFQAQHIVIVDDLLTTGSTVNELARLFRKNGVDRISVWCCARTG